MRFKDEEGQAIIIVALAMSTFLILAIGLAVDGSNLYTQRQMAQAAADAAAQAGIMSIFDATNSIPGNTAGFTATVGTGSPAPLPIKALPASMPVTMGLAARRSIR
jgi:uncharacterized membrane protein